MNRVIIAAAGWKGGGRDVGYPSVPLSFVPLCDGTTTLSRLSKQFSEFGYEVIVCIGQLGYPFHRYQPRGGRFEEWGRGRSIEQILSDIGVQPDDSPWTEGLLSYAHALGGVIQMPDPGWTNQHDTFCIAIDETGEHERLVLIQGDTLLSTSFLIQILSLNPPFQFMLCPNHSIFVLEGASIGAYREFAEAHRKRAVKPDHWTGVTWAYPDGDTGSKEIQGVGIKNYGWHTPPFRTIRVRSSKWMDIDHAPGHRDANERIQKGWYR